jgi:hypothetical protein
LEVIGGVLGGHLGGGNVLPVEPQAESTDHLQLATDRRRSIPLRAQLLGIQIDIRT